jgi:hypothetical protein
VPLTAQCADALQAVWNGKANAIAGALRFHEYSINESKSQYWRMWKKHPQGEAPHCANVWACDNLKDAGEKYSWTGEALDFPLLSLALQVAVSQGDHLRAAAICLKVLFWGGVRKPGKRMEKWLCRRAHQESLCGDLVDATARLIPRSSEPLDKFDGQTYIMNSSSTKLYAAMGLDLSDGLEKARQDVLIYDGRVAAGLALITRLILVSTGSTTIPNDLLFPVDASRGDARDPSISPYNFPELGYGVPDHRARAKFARIGSRYIQEVLGIHEPSVDFALAEKGLFMIGYDVRRPNMLVEMPSKEVRRSDRISRQSTTATALEEFKRRALELHKSGMTQKKAIEEAARQFNIGLTPAHTRYPGSYFHQWRTQGYS